MNKCNIYAFADEAAPEISGQIAAMLRNNLQGIEIRTVDGENISDITEEKAKEVRKQLDRNGLKVWSVGSPIGKINIETDDYNAHLEKFIHTLRLANILGAENMRMFSFYIPEGKDADDYKDTVIERLRQMADIAEDYGVTLCHENEKDIYGDTPERCLEIFTAVPKIKGIYDPANTVQCGCDAVKSWNMVKNHIYYLHIKDALANGNIVPAGCGIGAVPEILKEYIQMGGKHITIEPHLRVFSGFSHLEPVGGDNKIGNDYLFENSDESFDAACNACRALL